MSETGESTGTTLPRKPASATRFVAGWLAVAALSVGLALVVSFYHSGALVEEPAIDTLTTFESDAPSKTREIPLTGLEDGDMSEVLATVTLPPLYGGLIGRNVSVTALAKQYEDLAVRLPVLFGAFDPLIRIEDESDTLQASLIVGPFETPDDARLFCTTLRLEHQLPCKDTGYSGETFLPR